MVWLWYRTRGLQYWCLQLLISCDLFFLARGCAVLTRRNKHRSHMFNCLRFAVPPTQNWTLGPRRNCIILVLGAKSKGCSPKCSKIKAQRCKIRKRKPKMPHGSQKYQKISNKNVNINPKWCPHGRKGVPTNQQKCVRGPNRDKASIWVAKWEQKTRMSRPMFDLKRP